MPTKLYVTTDAATFALSPDGALEVLLVRRGHEPFKGLWAVPGGFVEEDEDLPDACLRELAEETGLKPAAFVQLGAWGKPGRDPRGRNVTVVYLAVVGPDGRRAVAGDDAADAAWYRVDALPTLAYDHDNVLRAAVAKLRLLALSTHIVFAMLPERFTLVELAAALGAVRAAPTSLDRAAAVAGCARLEMEEEDEGGVAVYRCAVSDFLEPLAGGPA